MENTDNSRGTGESTRRSCPVRSLKVGAKFQDVVAAKEFINHFNKENFCEFIVGTNNAKSLYFVCTHSRHRKSTSKGSRPGQHFNFLGCQAKIFFYKSQRPGDESLKVTQLDLEHSHPISEEIYNQKNTILTDEQKEMIKNLVSANASAKQVKRVLMNKAKKRVTLQKVRNIIRKVAPPETDEVAQKALQEFLVGLEDEGGDISWKNDPDGTLKVLFITSSKMKSVFRACNPPLVQLDTSFEFERARYKVAAFCYLDANMDRTGIAAFSFMSVETAECFDFALFEFSKICVRQDLIFVIDKDFTEGASIKKVFPSSIILLCIFHCFKFLRTLIATAPTTIDVKTDVFNKFKSVLRAASEEDFNQKQAEFLETVGDLTVKTKEKYVPLAGYYNKNWASCKHMWAMCFRKHLPLLGDNTSNRVERMFGALKVDMKSAFTRLPKTVRAIIHLVEFADLRLTEGYNFHAGKCLRIYNDKENIRNLNEEASFTLNEKGCRIYNQTLNRLEIMRDKLEITEEGVKQKVGNGKESSYVTTCDQCSCTKFAHFQAACIHVLFRREYEKNNNHSFPLFSQSIFNKRYHRHEGLVDLLSEADALTDNTEVVNSHDMVDDLIEEEVDTLVLSDKQKYNKIMPILIRLGNLVSVHGTKVFLEYLAEIEEVENRVRRGQKILGKNNRLEASNHEVVPPQEDLERLATNRDINEESVDGTESDEAGDGGNRFQDIRMKERVKTKGRPKGKSKQITFNKTAHDKKKQKNPEVINKRKKSKPDLIDDRNDVSDCESEQSVIFSKKLHKLATVNDILQDEEETDLSDTGSLQLESDLESFTAEDAFYSTTYRPVCSVCDEAIEEFSEFDQCKDCKKDCHITCYQKRVCLGCLS